MRGLDTNVLVRYITGDDAENSPIAKALIEQAEDREEQLFVSSIALCELVWALRSRPYLLPRGEIAAVLERMLGTKTFELQDRDLVHQALREYQQGRADFADYLLGRQN